MNGVEILSQVDVWDITGEKRNAFILLCVLTAAILFLSVVAYLSERYKAALYSIVIGVLMVLFTIFAFDKAGVSYVEYKVTISDSVSFNDFEEKYEILDKDGKIYTVREK